MEKRGAFISSAPLRHPRGAGVFLSRIASPLRGAWRGPPLHWCGGSGVAVRWCYLGLLGVGYFMR